MQQLSLELSVGPARIRFDATGEGVPDNIVGNTDFLDYRLAEVRLEAVLTRDKPDITWDRDTMPKSVEWAGGTLAFEGDWDSGPLQKAVVAMLALRLEEHGLHAFHSSAVRYKDTTVMFLGGESNHGKSMCQIEACRRGAKVISTETTLVDEAGVAVSGSKTVFLKSRAKGTERADKASPASGARKFFGDLPRWEEHIGHAEIEVVVVPSIDGNYDTSRIEMIDFERQFQTLHSLQNYFLLNELLAPGLPMPIIDTWDLRKRRAEYARRFCQRPFYLIRAATPQALIDEVEPIL